MSWTPKIESGCCTNGCLPATDNDREIEESLQLSAQSISYQTLWESGNMPVIKWDSDFEEFLKRQSELHDELRENRIQCVLPWEVLKALPPDRKKSDRLYWSQGGIGSCMGHGDCFAGHSAMLTQMALGSPLIYTPCNPVVTWALSKGGSLSGGQSVAPMAKWANEAGHFPESLVGTNNQSMPANWREHQTAARQYQWGIAFIPGSGAELADRVIQVCRAGFAVAYGTSTKITGATADSNRIKVVTIGGSWAHAMHNAAYRKIKQDEYIGNINSHGPRYPSSDEGEPADMAWLTRKHVEGIMAGATRYGQPYVVVPESTLITQVRRLIVPFPKNWRF